MSLKIPFNTIFFSENDCRNEICCCQVDIMYIFKELIYCVFRTSENTEDILCWRCLSVWIGSGSDPQPIVEVRGEEASLDEEAVTSDPSWSHSHDVDVVWEVGGRYWHRSEELVNRWDKHDISVVSRYKLIVVPPQHTLMHGDQSFIYSCPLLYRTVFHVHSRNHIIMKCLIVPPPSLYPSRKNWKNALL